MVQWQAHTLIQSCDKPEEKQKLENPAAAQYQYGNLLANGWFRLLILEPSDIPEYRMSCSLIHCPITTARSFEALSYTWGTDDAVAPMLIDGAVMCVRYNLYWALRNLRRSTESRVLWVDALCINQKNLAERSSQVAQMVQIYSCAASVIVWLGEGNEATDCGMEYLPKISHRARAIQDNFFASPAHEPGSRFKMYQEWVELYDSIHTLDDADTCFAGMTSVFFRPWWSRVWTLQEIVVAKQATVQIGTKTVSWQDIETFSLLCSVYLVHTENKPRPTWSKRYEVARFMDQPMIVVAYSIRILRMRRLEVKSSPLAGGGGRARGRRADDLRDKIYAVLGMVNDGPTMEIDYSAKIDLVYTQATRSILEYFGDLRAYGFISHDHRDVVSTLPSWVFNFQPPESQSFTYLDGSPPDYDVGPKPHGLVYNASAKVRGKLSRARMTFNNDCMSIFGIYVDDVGPVGTCAPARHDITSSARRSLSPSVTQWRTLAEGWKNSSIASGNWSNAFWRTVCADCKVIGYHPELTLKDNPRDRRRRLQSNDRHIPPRDHKAEERLIAALDKQATFQESCQCSRCFFITTTGHFGLGPQSLQNGDAVVVLFGSEVPFALRTVGKGRYKLLGQW